MVHKLLEQTVLPVLVQRAQLACNDDVERRWRRVFQGRLLDADRCSWNCVGTLLLVPSDRSYLLKWGRDV